MPYSLRARFALSVARFCELAYFMAVAITVDPAHQGNLPTMKASPGPVDALPEELDGALAPSDALPDLPDNFPAVSEHFPTLLGHLLRLSDALPELPGDLSGLPDDLADLPDDLLPVPDDFAELVDDLPRLADDLLPAPGRAPYSPPYSACNAPRSCGYSNVNPCASTLRALTFCEASTISLISPIASFSPKAGTLGRISGRCSTCASTSVKA